MSTAFLFLLLISSGHGFYPGDGPEFRKVPVSDIKHFDEMTWQEKQEAFAETLHGLYDEPSRSNRFMVQSPSDDEDLALVQEYLQDTPFDKTGQLRYSSVPLVESQLIEDIMDVIFSREEYYRLLNNPEESMMIELIKEMIRVPTQQVLKQQLLHKILAGRAWYEKFVNPMLENNKRQRLLNFGRHLLEARKNGTLSTKDTAEFNKNLQNIAFFDRPEDLEFRSMTDELLRVFGSSMNITIEKIASSTPGDLNSKDHHRHDLVKLSTELYDTTTTVDYTNVPESNSTYSSQDYDSDFASTDYGATTTIPSRFGSASTVVHGITTIIPIVNGSYHESDNTTTEFRDTTTTIPIEIAKNGSYHESNHTTTEFRDITTSIPIGTTRSKPDYDYDSTTTINSIDFDDLTEAYETTVLPNVAVVPNATTITSIDFDDLTEAYETTVLPNASTDYEARPIAVNQTDYSKNTTEGYFETTTDISDGTTFHHPTYVPAPIAVRYNQSMTEAYRTTTEVYSRYITGSNPNQTTHQPLANSTNNSYISETDMESKTPGRDFTETETEEPMVYVEGSNMKGSENVPEEDPEQIVNPPRAMKEWFNSEEELDEGRALPVPNLSPPS